MSIYGAYHGTYTVSGDNVSGTGTQYDFLSARTDGAGFSGIASAQNKLNITLNDSFRTTVNAGYLSMYDQPASLARLASPYSGTAVATNGARPASISISGSTVSVPTDAYGCSGSGTVKPHDTAHGTVGVFDLNVRFSDPNCLGNGATLAGIVVQPQPNGKGERSSPRTGGILFIPLRAVRPVGGHDWG